MTTKDFVTMMQKVANGTATLDEAREISRTVSVDPPRTGLRLPIERFVAPIERLGDIVRRVTVGETTIDEAKRSIGHSCCDSDPIAGWLVDGSLERLSESNGDAWIARFEKEMTSIVPLLRSYSSDSSAIITTLYDRALTSPTVAERFGSLIDICSRLDLIDRKTLTDWWFGVRTTSTIPSDMAILSRAEPYLDEDRLVALWTETDERSRGRIRSPIVRLSYRKRNWASRNGWLKRRNARVLH